MTSSYAAGTWLRASSDSLPAATAYVTPAAVERQIAWCSASPPVHELSDPLPPRLMLATPMPSAVLLAVTQSMPQTMLDHDPEPALLSTRTE